MYNSLFERAPVLPAYTTKAYASLEVSQDRPTMLMSQLTHSH